MFNAWKPLLHILSSAKARSTEQQIREALERTSRNHHYFRIDPPLIGTNTSMDDASFKQVKNLRELANQHVEQEQAQLQKLVKHLLDTSN